MRGTESGGETVGGVSISNSAAMPCRRPVQRIPRYRMLLETLDRRTPDDHADKQPLLEAVEAVRAAAADLDRQIAEHHDDDDVPPPFSFRAATAAPKVLLPAVEVTGCTDCVGCNGVFVTSGRRNGLLPMAMRPPPLLPLGCRCCPTDRSVRA